MRPENEDRPVTVAKSGDVVTVGDITDDNDVQPRRERTHYEEWPPIYCGDELAA